MATSTFHWSRPRWAWSNASMPLDWDHMTSSVVLIGDLARPGGGLQRGPIGSGFIVNIDELDIDEPTRSRFPHIVTAAHVVEGQAKIEVDALDAIGQPVERFHLQNWAINATGGPDVAIGFLWAEENRPPGTHFLGVGWRDLAITQKVLVRALKPGAEVFYVGLLAPLGKAIARSGTVAAVGLDDLPLNAYKYPAHLIDCRSYGGFSGSPVYLVEQFASTAPLDASWFDDELDDLGPVHGNIYLASLLGMFTAQFSEAVTLASPDGDERTLEAVHGVGIVLPAPLITSLLYHPNIVRMRREAEQMRDEEERAGTPVIAETKAKPPTDRDPDERVQIQGDPDAVLRGLLARPPNGAGSTN